MTDTDQPNEDMSERLRQVAEANASYKEARDQAQATLDAMRKRNEEMLRHIEEMNDRRDRSEAYREPDSQDPPQADPEPG